MNATYTDEITSMISNLRNSIYNSDAFIHNTINKLNASGYNPVFSYDPAGGINILITIDGFNINDINANVINPANDVFCIVDSPNEADTLLGVDSSVNFVGKLPLLIKSTKF